MGMLAGWISMNQRNGCMDVLDKMCSVLHHQSAIRKIEMNHAFLASEQMESIEIEGKKITIVLDGEVQNQSELMHCCRTKGIEVESNRTTELLLKLYLSCCDECVSKIKGVFAFVIVDERKNSFLLARDPMGIKPLFISVKRDQLVFASEIKGLLKHPEIKAQAGSEELMELICFGPARPPGKTYFKDIEEVKPGCLISGTCSGLTMMRYYTLKDDPWTLDETKTKEVVHDLVTDAILKQCDTDSKICAMLSGGLDSSIVVQAASSQIESMDVYSVDYQGQKEHFQPTFYQPNRDQDYIDLMIRQCDLNAHEIVLNSKELKDSLVDAMIARDMPGMADVDSSLLCFLKKMKEQNECVVLSGECSDEIFGGYPWYTQDHLRSIDEFPWASNVQYRASFLKKEFLICDPEQLMKRHIHDSLSPLNFHPDTTEKERQIKSLMKLNLDWFMQTLTDRADRMARSVGMSIRVPFCDLRIVEALYRIPWSMKYQKKTEKYLLRKAFEKELPEEICTRKKSPYPKTHHPEYAMMIKEELMKILEDDESPILEIIEKQKLMDLMETDFTKPWYGQLMTGPQTMAYFIQINEWLKIYDIEIIHPKG